MDKEFEDWAQEFGKTWKDSTAYQEFAKSNNGLGKELFAIYLQFKSQEKLINKTKWLVFGTWLLVIVTFIMTIATIILAFKK